MPGEIIPEGELDGDMIHGDIGPGEEIIEGEMEPGTIIEGGQGFGEVVIEEMPNELPGGMVTKGELDCCGGGGCYDCVPVGCLPVWCPIPFRNVELFSGVAGFTGPKNRGGTGSFGFDSGLNWGAPFPCSHGWLGMQFGARAQHSNFSGAEFTRDDRNQVFVTGGLFRRVDWGLQGGLVVDYQHDNWYTETDLVQLRGELSWLYPHHHEFGFWFTAHTQNDTALSQFSGQAQAVTETWEATDLFAFFYRHRFGGDRGGDARLFAGFTNRSDGLIGSNARLPLSDTWALETEYTYLVPDENRTGLPGGGHEEESWNVGIHLVWSPGRRAKPWDDYFRPLFGVANNGTFMVDRK